MKRRASRLVAGMVLLAVAVIAIGSSGAIAFGSVPARMAQISGPVSPWAVTKGGDQAVAKTTPPSISGDTLHLQTTVAQPQDLTAHPLPAMPVTDTLNPGDEDRVYAWNLAAGQTAYMSMTGDPGTDFDLYLYDPGSSLVTSSTLTDYPEFIAYPVPETGTYYLRVHEYSGTGSFSVRYGIDTDGWYPGRTLQFPPTPFYGTLDNATKMYSMFNIYSFAGQNLQFTCVNCPGADFDMYLFDTNGNLVDDTSAQNGDTDYLSYPAPATGTYHLLVRTYRNTGSGWYNLSYARDLAQGTFNPVLSVSKTKLRRGATAWISGRVNPAAFAGGGTVVVQKLSGGHWIQSRTCTLNSGGVMPRFPVSYTSPTTQSVRLYMPPYSDAVRGVSYAGGYSAAVKIRWTK
jgi:hypothetical protein